MKCLFYFGISSMKEGTSAQGSGRGKLHGGARVITLVPLRKCTLSFKRVIKVPKLVLASTKAHGSDFFLLSQLFHLPSHSL